MEKERITEADPITGCRLSRLNFDELSDFRREHFHEEIELVKVTEGEILCLVGGDSIKLSRGDVLVIGSRVIHRLMYLDAPASAVYIQTDIEPAVSSVFPRSEILSCLLGRNAKKYALFSDDGDMDDIFSSLCRELDEKKSFYSVAVKGDIYRLIALMCRAGMIESEAKILSQKMFKRIMPALEYANSDFAAKITLDELCRELNYDKYNFCKQFKAATGMTFFDYLGLLRLKHAEELLISTEKNVTEISLECGFSSLQYFNRFFSERTGYSPTAYRKMLGEAD